jgi:hypothetical protein
MISSGYISQLYIVLLLAGATPVLQIRAVFTGVSTETG